MVVLSLQVKENNYRGHGDSVDQLCWHPSNPDLFVTASGDKTIRIWDVRTTKCIATVNTKGEALPSEQDLICGGPLGSGTVLWTLLVGIGGWGVFTECCYLCVALMWKEQQ